MRRALWLGAFFLTVAAAACQPSDDSDGGDLNVDASLTVPEGGTSDESGTSQGNVDVVSPTFAGIKSATALSETQVGVAWEPASDNQTAQGTIAYRVYVSETAGGQNFAAAAVTAPAGSTGATVAGLAPFKKYFFVVRSVDASGNEDTNTAEASATTLDVHAPSFAGAKTVVGTGANDVLVSWDPASDNGSVPADITYELYATTTQGAENYASATATTAPGATSATISGLPEATPIFVVVRAIDKANNKDANKKEASGKTLDKTPPTFAGIGSATSLGTTINLSWNDASDNVDDKTGIVYDVFQATSAGGQDFTTPTFTTLPGVTNQAVPNLTVSTKYYFVVRARDVANNVDQNVVEKSATTAASPDIKAPTFAGLQTASATTDQTIDLSWNAAVDDYSPAAQIVYDIYLSPTPGGQVFATPSFTTAPGATQFTVTGLLPLQKSYFVVRARDAAGNGDTNVVEKNATTLADLVPPAFAGLTSATTLSPTTIQLSWSPATDDVSAPATIKYRIYRATAAGAENFNGSYVDVAAGQTSAIVGSLTPNTDYYFVVRAVDEVGNLDSNTVEKTAATLPDTTAPTFAGANGITSLSATTVTVSWNAANDDVTPSGQIVYLPFLATSSGGQTFNIAPTPTAAGATNYTFNNLVPNTPYFVVVRARDAAGNVDTNVVQQTISTQADTTAPTFGGAQSVTTATEQSLKVNWNAATDNSTASASMTYLVCMTQVAGGCSGGSFVTTATVAGPLTSRTFTNLTALQTYYFVVRAKDAYNNVDTNNVQVSGTTLADTIDPTFGGLSTAVSATPTTIDLTWSAGSDNYNTAGQLVYDIFQSSSSGGQNFSSASYTTAAGATTYKVQGLLPAQKWYFVVRARDLSGNSDNNVIEKTATVIADTTAPTFGGVTSVVSTGLTSLQASWNAATDNVTAQAALVYDVCWATDGTCVSAFTAKSTTAAGATSANITGLLANTTYNVVVRARDGYNNRDTNTTTVAKKTDADVTAPVFTGSPQVTGSSATTLTLQWQPATDNYSAAANLQYLACISTTASGCTGASFAASYTVTNQFSHTFTGLTNLQTYYFVVRARDQANNTDTNNNVVSGQTATDTTPPTFAGLASATALTATSIQLNWSAASDNVSSPAQIVYDIYQAASAGGESYVTPTVTSAAGATQHIVTGLSPSTPHYFVVRARDVGGNRDTNTTERNAATLADTTKPTFAGVTSVSQVSNSQLTAHWTAATDDTTPSANIFYRVCWATDASCTVSFVTMATTAAGATSYTTPVKTLVPNTSYTFVVRAVDAYANVDLNTASATNSTVPDTTAPTFAGATSVTGVTYKNATINWSAAADDYTSAANMRYYVCVTTSSGGCNDNAFVAAGNVTGTTSYSFTTLTPNTPYYFVVRARDQANNYNALNQNLQVSTTTAQETNAPTFAGLASATATGSSSIQLQWTAASDDYSSAAQIKYNVYRGTSAGAENFVTPYATDVTGVAGTNTYNAVTGLSPGTAYYWVVRAKDAAGNIESNVVERSATTLATVPSFTVQPSSSAQTTSTLTFGWAASSTPATTINYQYCISTSSGFCDNFVSGTSTGTTASATPGGLVANTTYYFRVKATNSTGSTYSNQVSATTDPVPPSLGGVITCNSGKAIGSSAEFAYTANYWARYLNISTSTASTGSLPLAASNAYEICWSTNSLTCALSFTANATATSAPSQTYFGANALTPNTTYYIRVRAKDTGGNYSNVVAGSCKTPISGATNLDPWLSTNCNGCHTGVTYPGPFTASYLWSDNGANLGACAGQSYVDRVNFTLGASYMWKKTNLGSPGCGVLMPQGAVTPLDTTLLNTWITQGGRNN